MNEENIQTQENIFPTEKIETNLQEVNSSINKLLEFFQTDKQEKQEKDKRRRENPRARTTKDKRRTRKERRRISTKYTNNSRKYKYGNIGTIIK